ncbi:MAG: hypothetical protein AAFZ15_22035 [Bacteroidota bacterium]
MPTPLSALDEIKELLANGDTEEAADMLLALSKSSYQAHYHSALLLKNRIETLQHNVIDGVLSSNEERIEWARISKGVVELVGQIDKGERPLSMEELHAPPEPRKIFHKPLLWAVPVILFLGVFGIWNFYKGKTENVPAHAEIKKEETVEQRGQLIYSDRKPIDDVTITIKSTLLNKDIFCKTNEQGVFTFKYPEKLRRKKVQILFEKNGKPLDVIEGVFLPEYFKEITLQKK